MNSSDILIKKIATLSDDMAKALINCNNKDYDLIVNKLESIIELINLNDFIKKDKFFMKLLNKNNEDKLYEKYNKICLQVEKIAVELKVYENKINKINEHLKKLYKSNIQYKEELEKIIRENNESEKLIYDLNMSKIILTQNLPLLDNLIKVYTNLLTEINVSFMTALPIVNQCLNNIIELKRKKMSNEAFSYLDKNTKDFLKENNMEVSNESKKLVEVFGKDILILEETIKTINDGIHKGKIIVKKINT